MTSAVSITRSTGAPRAAFLDFPLGHTAGKPDARMEQRAIMTAALRLFETLDAPGEIVPLPFRWSDDESWKTPVSETKAAGDASKEGAQAKDDRTERRSEPEYQTAKDRERAAQTLATGGCETCVFFEDGRSG